MPFAQKPSTAPSSSALAATMPKEAPAPEAPGTGAMFTSRSGSMPDSTSMRFKPSAGPGAAPMRRPLSARSSPRFAPMSLRTTRNQYMFCESAQISLHPVQSRNA